MFSRLLASALPRGELRAPNLRYLYTGGAALDPTLKRDAERYFGLPMHHGYGITEYAGSMFITDMDRPRGDCSSGSAVDGVEWRIGSGPRHAGAWRARHHPDPGPGVMLGYYRDPEQTRALLPGGWLDTGDIGYVDADGALFIAGRSKDLIIRSGFNVYPIEVESVINAFPGVRLSAVVGRQTEDHNEECRRLRRAAARRRAGHPPADAAPARAARAVQAARADHSHRRHTHHGQRKNPGSSR